MSAVDGFDYWANGVPALAPGWPSSNNADALFGGATLWLLGDDSTPAFLTLTLDDVALDLASSIAPTTGLTLTLADCSLAVTCAVATSGTLEIALDDVTLNLVQVNTNADLALVLDALALDLEVSTASMGTLAV